MNWKKIARIASFEIGAALRTKQFWIGVLVLPVVIALTTAASSAKSSWFWETFRDKFASDAAPPLALYDASGIFHSPGEICATSAFNLGRFVAKVFSLSTNSSELPETFCVPSIEAGQQALQNGQASALLEIAEDFNTSGKYRFYHVHQEPSINVTARLFETHHRRLLIEKSNLDENIKNRLLQPFTSETLILRNGKFINSDDEKEPAFSMEDIRRGISYVITGVLAFILFICFSASLGCTHTERASHLIEVILSSSTAAEYLLGKVIAVSIVNLLQLIGMASLSLLPLLGRYNSLWLKLASHLPLPGFPYLILASLIFILGCLMAGLIGAGIGTMTNTEVRSRNGRHGMFVLMLNLSMIFCYQLFTRYGAATLDLLYYVPPFSAAILPARLIMGTASIWQALAAILVLGTGAYLSALVAAQVLRVCLYPHGFSDLLRRKLLLVRARKDFGGTPGVSWQI